MRGFLGRIRHLSPGVIDAAVASIATFGTGLAGVNLLSDSDRGVYGIFFTAFFLGSVIVNESILVPSQVVAVNKPEGRHLEDSHRGFLLALAPSVVACQVATLAAILNRDIASSEVLFALGATTFVTIVLSPMQDHSRQLLHIAGRSWEAAIVSVVQLAVVAVSITTMFWLDVTAAWIPFGSLALANAVSLTCGILLTRRGLTQIDSGKAPTLGYLLASGKWLVVRSALPALLAFASANIITQLAGSVAYGYAEAARQVAQPVAVLASGLLAMMAPPAIRAAAQHDRSAARHNRRVFFLVLGAATTSYLLVASWDWALNPMSFLVPSAYVVGGLVAATVVANALTACFRILSKEMLGAERARTLAGISLISAPFLPIAAVTAGTTEAFARPLGYILEGVTRMSAAGKSLHQYYGNPVPLDGERAGHDQ